MSREDRSGNRKKREHHENRRMPKLGYYLVVTDAEGTEPNYLNGLHDSLPECIRDKLVIKVVETKTQNLVQKCLEMTAYDAQYRIPWIVFDRDKVVNFDEIIAAAERESINVGWSNPCFEIWMYAYFGKMPTIVESKVCCSQFGRIYKKKTGIEYSKTDNDIYRRLCLYGDESKALAIATQRHMQHMKSDGLLPSEMIPCTTVYELVGEIKGKMEEEYDSAKDS